MRGLTVLLVVFVFASGASFLPAASAQGSASLDGMVCVASPWMAPMGNDTKGSACIDSGGQGLPGATVTLTRSGMLPSPAPAPLGPATATATSDANGHYSITGLGDGDYSYSVTRQGFKVASGTVTVSAGTRLDAVLTGEPVDAHGEVTGPNGAIAGAEVMLCCGTSGQHAGKTGADGRYSVSVQAGYWSVDVRASGYQPQSRSLLVDGSAIDVKLEAIPPQDARLAGTVLDQHGNPVPDARVSLYSYGGCCSTYAGPAYGAPDCYGCGDTRPYYSGENVTMTDSQGRFSMGAYSGSNGLTVTKDGYAGTSRTVDVAAGQPNSVDVKLMKYPEKTAKVTGKVVDAKTGKGLANAYVNLQSPEYGLYECSQGADSASGGGSSGSSVATATANPEPPMAKDIAVGEPAPAYDPGCAIRTHSDGSFEGLVTPGYAILNVYVDTWSACWQGMQERGETGSSSSFDCDTYYTWVKSVVLPANATTSFDVKVRQRPGPDAEASGYVVDAETGKAIPGAQVSFSNQDSYGYGTATTDKDGSYRIALRSGYHSVTVWAEGHLRWEGVLDVAKGDTPFDVTVQPGQEANGYYGPYYGGGYAMAADAKSSSAASGTSAPAPQAAGGMDGGREATQSGGDEYQDLGGGLGPYDASKRASQLDEPSNGSPGLGLVALVAALGAVVALRRRQA